MNTTEELIFSIVSELGEGEYENFSIHSNDREDSRGFKVYHKEAYCWELMKEINEDGEEIFTFYEPWLDQGFKESGIEKAFLLLNFVTLT